MAKKSKPEASVAAAPHGITATHADQINTELLRFLGQGSQGSLAA